MLTQATGRHAGNSNVTATAPEFDDDGERESWSSEHERREARVEVFGEGRAGGAARLKRATYL